MSTNWIICQLVTVGGISEKVVPWDTNTSYISGEVILHNNAYYRVITSFTSEQHLILLI